MDQAKVVQVVDLLLSDSCVKDKGPNFLVVPLNVVKLFSEVEQGPLIEANLSFPERKDDMLFEVSIE